MSIPTFFLLLSLLRLANGACFTPDGGLSKDLPCNASAANSVCCEAGWACMSNGLCQPRDDNWPGDKFVRGTCTDKTWAAPECMHECVMDNPSGGEWVMRCPNQAEDDSWCCASDGCCSTNGPRLALGEANITATAGAMATTSSPASSSPPTSPTSSSINPAVTTESHADGDDSGRSNGRSLGIGLGIGIGVSIALAGLLGSLWMCYRKRKVRRAGAVAKSPGSGSGSGSALPAELPVQPAAQEMEAYQNTHQLYAGGYGPPAELTGDVGPPKVQ